MSLKSRRASEVLVTKTRENFLMGFIGHNRTGKTSIAMEIAKEWKKSRPDGTVIGFDPQNRMKEISVNYEGVQVPLLDVEIKLFQQGQWYDEVLKYRNCLLILDDYRNLHESSKPEKGWLKLMSFRNEYNIDIIYITHLPALILNILTGYTTHYFIFKTMVQQGSFEKKIPHYALCMTAAYHVNRYVKNFGKGKYPNFPYILVNTQDETLTSHNMGKDYFNNLK